MKKAMIVFGTRPEGLKLAPVVKAFANDKRFRTRVVVSSQHQEMLQQVLNLFQIRPHYDLSVMMPKQSLFALSAVLLEKMQVVLEKEKPDIIIVQGDTTTTFIAALSAFYKKIPVAHVEAGLRSHNIHHPFPEEMNRILTSSLTDINFAPTRSAADNLLKQGINKKTIRVVGNTIIDSLHYILAKNKHVNERLQKKMFVLVTAHRRENWGKPLQNLCQAINDVCKVKSDTLFVFAVHKNPVVREVISHYLKQNSNVKLIEPQDYESFIKLLNECYFVLSDSGGIQEEAPALGKPVLVFRKTTERPEGVAAGLVKLVGQERQTIANATLQLLDNKKIYNQMSKSVNLYGDGMASSRIVDIIGAHFENKAALATTAKR